MAKARLQALADLSPLGVSDEASSLAKALIAAGAPPAAAPEDALHIAISVVNGLEYLLTWNCRHIANAAMRRTIERVCRAEGLLKRYGEFAMLTLRASTIISTPS